VDLWCPWLNPEVAGILARPMRWNASHLGALLSVTPEERQRLGLTTIGSRGTTKEERKAESLRRRRKRQKAKRWASGMIPREQYEAQSLSRMKPWQREGISRRTWERRRRRANAH
jgi:hypothetical protein